MQAADLLTMTDADSILPTQFYAAREGAPSPEQRLLLAALEECILSLRGRRLGHITTLTRATRRHDEDVAWVASDDRTYGSFLHICDALGFAPEPLRRALLAGIPETFISNRRHQARRPMRVVEPRYA